MKQLFLLGLLILAMCCPVFAQDLPSQAEITDLTRKVDEKVIVFETALRAAKPFIPDENFKKFSNAADTAHVIIRNLQQKGPTAYSLVALVMTLDDLVIDARLTIGYIFANGLKLLSEGKGLQPGAAGAATFLDDAATACYDMSELIGHTTLRFIDVEEKIIDKIAK